MQGYGGKTVYGARIGILMLDTKWPRPPGDTGNAMTWPFPVLYKVVPGASARVVIHEQGKGLGPAFLKAAEELVKAPDRLPPRKNSATRTRIKNQGRVVPHR